MVIEVTFSLQKMRMKKSSEKSSEKEHIKTKMAKIDGCMHMLLKIGGCSCNLCTCYYEGPVWNLEIPRTSYNQWVLKIFRLLQIWPKLNLGRYKLQKMGWMGSKEIYLIWAKFGITEICSGLIDITGSRFKNVIWHKLFS